MNDIWQFVVDNWQYFSSLAISIVGFILLLIFKNKKIITFVDEYYEELVDLVLQAEDIFGAGHGSEKKQYVINCFALCHPGRFTKGVLDVAIEKILSTPQRKEKK